MQTCPDCGRTFGGAFAFGRHVDRRRDRCRPDRELRARGLVLTDGVWRQRPPHGQRQFPGFRRHGGSRTIERAPGVSYVEPSPFRVLEPTPTTNKGVAAEGSRTP